MVLVTKASMISGVPKFSILGPLHLNFFVNDTQLVIRYFSLIQYTDDITLFLAVSAPNDRFLLQK